MDMGFVWLMIGVICICNILKWHAIFDMFKGNNDDEEEDKS